MKIYTYYQEIAHEKQHELIDLWKTSWSRQGYEPIILNLEDAKKHPYFEAFNLEIRRISKEIIGKDINNYGMSCWFRWLAYATVNDSNEKFYVSDYDAININFPITEPNDKLNLLCGNCPFIASGTSKQFENLCKAFITVSNERLGELKAKAHKMKWYHDQEFFFYNDAICRSKKYDILITRDTTKFSCRRDIIPLVYHASHSSVSRLLKHNLNYDKTDPALARIQIIKDILKLPL